MTHAAAPNLVRDDHALAFHRVRMALGVLGMALPLLLALSGRLVDGHVQPSISDFFHTSARDLFVGGLTAIAVFMITHKGLGAGAGHQQSRLGSLFAILAGVSALGVALIPNEAEVITTLSQEILGLGLAPALHYGAATMFYLMMSLTCLLVYARTTTGWEARFHRIMGWTVWCTGWAVMLLTFWKRSGAPGIQAFTIDNNLIFWDESLGVWAFCASWLVQAHCEFKRAHRRRKGSLSQHSSRPAIGVAQGATPPDDPRPKHPVFARILSRLDLRGRVLPEGSALELHAQLHRPARMARHHHRASTTARRVTLGARGNLPQDHQKRRG
ncbi:MAG: hypothetical protein ACRBCL_00240 [Maritimibacter sp.]